MYSSLSQKKYNCVLTSNGQKFSEPSEMLFLGYNTQFGMSEIFHFFLTLTD